jgi:hypothetical protein
MSETEFMEIVSKVPSRSCLTANGQKLQFSLSVARVGEHVIPHILLANEVDGARFADIITAKRILPAQIIGNLGEA